MMATSCTCDRPFTEDSLLCDMHEQAEIYLMLSQDDDRIPTGADWDDFAARQG